MPALFELIKLSDKEAAEIERYERSFGVAWAVKAFQQRQARKYLEDVCELVKDKSKYGQPYNCCSTGSEVYRRKDGAPICDDDLAALRAIDKGQENSVSRAESGMEMTHRWLCDSSG